MKKLLAYLYFIVCFSLILSTPAYAYLDPSVMTYTVQVVAGIAVAVGAVVGIYWRRAKRKVQEKLGIDENANKEVEEEIVEFSEDEAAVKADEEKKDSSTVH